VEEQDDERLFCGEPGCVGDAQEQLEGLAFGKGSGVSVY